MKREYVLITPVNNEEDFIGQVIESVVSQSILPRRWVIVDDNSTDGTNDIINRYKQRYDFIELKRLGRGNIESDYSHRVSVVLAGIEATKTLKYDFLGVLDADITLELKYYEELLEEFDRNTKLGIASGIYADKVGEQLQEVLIDTNHTPGGIQMIRRQCYEAIGGYIPKIWRRRFVRRDHGSHERMGNSLISTVPGDSPSPCGYRRWDVHAAGKVSTGTNGIWRCNASSVYVSQITSPSRSGEAVYYGELSKNGRVLMWILPKRKKRHPRRSYTICSERTNPKIVGLYTKASSVENGNPQKPIEDLCCMFNRRALSGSQAIGASV